MAQSTVDGPMKIPSPDGDPKKAHRFMMHHFVTTTGGEYFFQPSIDALRDLSGAPAPSKTTEAKPSDDDQDIDDPTFDPCAAALKEANADDGAVAPAPS